MIDHPDFSVVVKHRAPPPKLWRWEIYRAGRNSAIECSAVFFETMTEASRAGKVALHLLLSEHHDVRILPVDCALTKSLMLISQSVAPVLKAAFNGKKRALFLHRQHGPHLLQKRNFGIRSAPRLNCLCRAYLFVP